MITIKSFFHHETATFSYVVFDESSKDAVIIDPVLDFDPLSATISFNALNEIEAFIKQHGLTTQLIMDTHIHADHVTGAYFLQKRLGAKTAISAHFSIAQAYFAELYAMDITHYDRAYDLFLTEGPAQCFGSIPLKTFFTPGHTPTCASYLIDNNLFVGDAIFQPALGSGRTDFPFGSAKELYHSVKEKIFTLPDETKVFVGHDYPKNQEEPTSCISLLELKKHNILINDSVAEKDFIHKRQERDKTLSPPRLFLFAMQINILGGRLPDKRFLKIPFTVDN